MKVVKIIDNKDIEVEQLKMGNTVISTNVTPKVPIQEQTPAYRRKYAKWL